MRLIYTRNEANDRTSKKLDEFVRTELAVANLYIKALKTIEDTAYRSQLVTAMHCHQGRAARVAGRVRQLGGRPSSASGTWLPFTGATPDQMLPQAEVVALLVEGEEQTSRKYDDLMSETDFEVQQLAGQLHGAQQSTCKGIHDLQKQLSESAA